MNGFEISDYELLRLLRNKIRIDGGQQYYNNLPELAGVANCLIKSKPNGVTVVNANKKLKTYGTFHCHRHSICPICAAFKHQQLKSYLISAFKMQAKEKKSAFMFTFTVPSKDFILRNGEKIYITCDEMLKLLLGTQARFLQNRFFQDLRAKLHIKDSFFVTETTYNTINGWHPHNHALYWLPDENLQELLKYEDKMREKWAIAFRTTLKKVFPYDENSNADVDVINRIKLNTLLKCFEKSEMPGVFISKNKDGSIRKADSANYFWSSTDEITGTKFKKARAKNSYSIFQLLEMSLKDSTAWAWARYREFAKASYKRQIFRFSGGFLKAIKSWIKDNPEPIVEKKSSEQEKEKQVCWFTSHQWNYLNHVSEYFFELLRTFITYDNNFELINELSISLGAGSPLAESPFKLKDKKFIA